MGGERREGDGKVGKRRERGRGGKGREKEGRGNEGRRRKGRGKGRKREGDAPRNADSWIRPWSGPGYLFMLILFNLLIISSISN